MIAHRQTDVALAYSFPVLVHIALQESLDVSLALRVEIAVPLAHTVQDAPVLFLEQVVVAVEPMEEIHMEAVVQRIGGIGPLCHHEALWILLFQQASDFAPE